MWIRIKYNYDFLYFNLKDYKASFMMHRDEFLLNSIYWYIKERLSSRNRVYFICG